MSNNSKPQIRPVDPRIERRRRIVEGSATFGLLLVAAGLLSPFAALTSVGAVGFFKWIFAAGGVIYTVARAVNVNDPLDSSRLRRLRRMEAWAGICFCVAAFFWFYNAGRLPSGGSLFILRETIAFTLAGAMIQIIASWMIAVRDKKERTLNPDDKGKKSSGKKV